MLKIRGVDFEFYLATSAMEVINNIITHAKSVGCEEPTHDSIIQNQKVIPHEGLVAEGKIELNEEYFYFSIVNNPTGKVAKRKEIEKLIEEAKDKGTKIILDDVYGYFSDSNAFIDDNVIYVSSFSRILGSGIRIAFTNMKTNSKPSSLSQYLVKRLYEMGTLKKVIDMEKEIYSSRLNGISKYFEKYLYKKPEGGVSILLSLPPEKFNAKVIDGSIYFRRKIKGLTRLTISRYDIKDIIKIVKV